jgi:hypothetical protein
VSEKHLHIISFDVPFPPAYGGIVDIFFRLKALSKAGVKIHLHCFHYGRKPADELKQYCVSVNYYSRSTSVLRQLSSVPYIVYSRKNKDLIDNLLKDDHPVLMEGIHTTYYLNDKRLLNRKIIVRSHNIEHDYYHYLAETEDQFFKRYYFRAESRKLKTFEPVLSKANKVAAISSDDTLYINSKYHNAFYLPAFHGNETVESKEGGGTYALYHGSLGVGENDFAALFLVNQIFSKTSLSLIIAGNNPSEALIAAASKYKNITIKKDPAFDEMKELIQNAQVNILPTFQSTGIKLKLINALFNGRFCLVNSQMVKNTGLESLCRIADSDSEMINALQDVFSKSFTREMIEKRRKMLESQFNSNENVHLLIEQLF